MKSQHILVTLVLGSLLLACSKSGGGGGGGSRILTNITQTPTVETDNLEVEMSGTYQALLAPVNKKVSGHLNGSLTLVREKDEFIADVRLSNGPASSLHSQHIHVGRCPTDADDLNADGFIDAEEGAKVYKEILIPLDDDLSSQWIGLGIFPVTDEYGYYFWSRSVSFEKMMADLREEDINLKDDFVKLAANKTLSPLNLVVVIKGVPDTAALPETVSGRGRDSKFAGLPIACGLIRKLTNSPGVIDNDRTGIPVPANGETVGGSGGADDGAIFTNDTEPGSTGGGNYGEEDDDVETRDNSTEYDGTPRP